MGTHRAIDSAAKAPLHDPDRDLDAVPEAELAQYKNKSYFFSSFELSQQDIFEAVKRVTGTSNLDWSITEKDANEIIQESEVKIKDGDGYAEWYRLFVMFFQGQVAGIINMEFCRRDVLFDRFGCSYREKHIVFTPHQ